MVQAATQFCVVLVHTYIKSFQFFRINVERTTGLRTPLPIFCLFILFDVHCKQCQREFSFSGTYMAKHMHCMVVQEGLSRSGTQLLNHIRNCASTGGDSSDDAVSTSK